jgi:hypothetical protein
MTSQRLVATTGIVNRAISLYELIGAQMREGYDLIIRNLPDQGDPRASAARDQRAVSSLGGPYQALPPQPLHGQPQTIRRAY